MVSVKNNIHSVLCCGCGGCEWVCPINCIKIKQNAEGFYAALCDDKKCIGCGKCIKVCPMFNSLSSCQKTMECYAAVSQEKNIYAMGASGGVFPQIAKYILENGGYVFGCGYDLNVPKHKEINLYSQLDDLCRSKYVQSFLGDCYVKVKVRLEEKIPVLFVGTPCQVSGLKKYLGKDYRSLYLIDIVCHGVPSAGMFQQHMEFLQDIKKKKVSRYEFRLKSNSAKKNKSYSVTYLYEDGSNDVKPYQKDVFFNEFYDTTSLNECCYQCPYACDNRSGDITIGDFDWGKKYHPEYKDFDDISCILINTEKGRRMTEWINRNMLMIPTKLEYIVEKNLNLVRPTVRPKYRNRIFKEIEKKGYKKWANQYFISIRYMKKLSIIKPFFYFKSLLKKIIIKSI